MHNLMLARHRFFPLFSACALILLLASAATCCSFPFLIYNTTDSLPHGLYAVVPRQDVRHGDLVVFRVPDRVAPLVHERQWLRDDGFLMKRVAALAGDSVSVAGGRFIVAGRDFGPVLDRDSEGRPMPDVAFCGILEEGVVVALPGPVASFDSRYFGALPADSILGVALPLWTDIRL